MHSILVCSNRRCLVQQCSLPISRFKMTHYSACLFSVRCTAFNFSKPCKEKQTSSKRGAPREASVLYTSYVNISCDLEQAWVLRPSAYPSCMAFSDLWRRHLDEILVVAAVVLQPRLPANHRSIDTKNAEHPRRARRPQRCERDRLADPPARILTCVVFCTLQARYTWRTPSCQAARRRCRSCWLIQISVCASVCEKFKTLCRT